MHLPSPGPIPRTGAPVIGIAPPMPDRPGVAADYVHPDYVQAVSATGAVPLVLPPAGPWVELGLLLGALDGLLVPGSDQPLPPEVKAQPVLPTLREQQPRRYDSDVAWLRGALAWDLPVLAICRGMQTLNEVQGGTLHNRLYPPALSGSHRQDQPGARPWHRVVLEPGSLVARALGPGNWAVNSFHVQGVDQPGAGLRVTARAPDGVVEAIEAPGHRFVLGLQFHPERMDAPFGALFAAFVRAAANRPHAARRPCHHRAAAVRAGG